MKATIVMHGGALNPATGKYEEIAANNVEKRMMILRSEAPR
jgi:hypothetical protein